MPSDPSTDGPGLPPSSAPPSAIPAIADTRGIVNYGRVFAAEVVGTAVLVLCGPGSAILAGERIGLLGISLAFGFAFAVMAYVIGPISGCHINPAVTLAMWLIRKITIRRAVYSWIAQVVGGIVGATIIYGIASGRDGFEPGGFASNGWDRDGFSGLGSTIVVEIVFTALILVVLGTTGPKFAAGFNGLTAGIALALIHLVTIPIDNTGVNPARSLATAIFADTDPSALGQLWAFIVFPLIGSVVGVFVWLLVDDSSLEDTRMDTDVLRAARDKVDDAIN